MSPGDFDEKLAAVLPEYMTMGQHKDAKPDDPDETIPKNSIPMMGGAGPFGYITMGGMFTVLKVRDGIRDYSDPGWFQHPAGSVAGLATASEIEQDGIKP